MVKLFGILEWEANFYCYKSFIRLGYGFYTDTSGNHDLLFFCRGRGVGGEIL